MDESLTQTAEISIVSDKEDVIHYTMLEISVLSSLHPAIPISPTFYFLFFGKILIFPELNYLPRIYGNISTVLNKAGLVHRKALKIDLFLHKTSIYPVF